MEDIMADDQEQEQAAPLAWNTETHGPLNAWNHGDYVEQPASEPIQAMATNPDGERVPFATEAEQADESESKPAAKKAASSK